MPLMNYVKKGYQQGGMPMMASPHDSIDNLISESDNTLLGLATGLLSRLGIMEQPYQQASQIPPLSETGKITDENLKDAFDMAKGAFSLESIGGPAKGAGSLLTLTKGSDRKKIEKMLRKLYAEAEKSHGKIKTTEKLDDMFRSQQDKWQKRAWEAEGKDLFTPEDIKKYGDLVPRSQNVGDINTRYISPIREMRQRNINVGMQEQKKLLESRSLFSMLKDYIKYGG